MTNYLEPLVDVARQFLPRERIKAIPLFLMATGGMRRLKEQNHYGFMILRTAIIEYINTCGFDDAQYKTISGEDEALYGWVAVNYVDNLFLPAANTHGFMEMGGESAQFAVSLQGPDYGNYNGILREVTIGGEKHLVFVKSWLGLGAESAWKRHEEKLRESESIIAHDPCLPKEFAYRLSDCDKIVLGTGDFDQCLKETFSLLSCPDKRCLAGHLCIYQSAGVVDNPQTLSAGCLLRDPITGKPYLTFDTEQFGGASVYWHAMHGIFGRSKTRDDFAKFWNDVHELSGMTWEQIRADKIETSSRFVQRAFFTAGMVMSSLFYGYGIPMPLSARSATASMALEKATRSLARAEMVAASTKKKYDAAERIRIALIARAEKAEEEERTPSIAPLHTKADSDACSKLYHDLPNEQNRRDMVATMSWETGEMDEIERKKEASREARMQRAHASTLATETYSTWVEAKGEVRETKILLAHLTKKVKNIKIEVDEQKKAGDVPGTTDVFTSVSDADWPLGRIVLHANCSDVHLRSKHGWAPVVAK